MESRSNGSINKPESRGVNDLILPILVEAAFALARELTNQGEDYITHGESPKSIKGFAKSLPKARLAAAAFEGVSRALRSVR